MGLRQRGTRELTVLVGLLGTGAGFAIAHSPAEPIAGSEAGDCNPAAVAEYEDRGIQISRFYPRCPTLEEAEANAAESQELRLRGLTRLAENIRRGPAGDETRRDLEEIEAQIEQLGGSDPEFQAEVEQDLDSAMSLEEAEALAQE